MNLLGPDFPLIQKYIFPYLPHAFTGNSPSRKKSWNAIKCVTWVVNIFSSIWLEDLVIYVNLFLHALQMLTRIYGDPIGFFCSIYGKGPWERNLIILKGKDCVCCRENPMIAIVTCKYVVLYTVNFYRTIIGRIVVNPM